MTRRVGVVLAGGRATRVGGADKALFEVGGLTLLERAVQALAACDEVIVVGPAENRPAVRPEAASQSVRWVREDPPHGGPVAALRHALDHTDADELVVVPADLPGAREAVARLLASDRTSGTTTDAIVLTDDDGQPQWLTARLDARALRNAIDSTGASAMRTVVGAMSARFVEAPPYETRDVDTWEDLDDARIREADHERRAMSEHNPPTQVPPEALNDWVNAACAEVGIDPAEVDVAQILDLAREVAHGVARPAAPVTAFIAGLAVARGADAADVAARLSQRAGEWQQP